MKSCGDWLGGIRRDTAYVTGNHLAGYTGGSIETATSYWIPCGAGFGFLDFPLISGSLKPQ
jgi:hypothetical protein